MTEERKALKNKEILKRKDRFPINNEGKQSDSNFRVEETFVASRVLKQETMK